MNFTKLLVFALCTAASVSAAAVLVGNNPNTIVIDEPKNSFPQESSNDSSIWKGTPMKAVVEEFKTECLQQTDSVACIKFKVLNLLEDVLQKNSFRVSETVSIVPNEKETEEGKLSRSSSDGNFMDQLEEYIESHDLLLKTPKDTFLQGTTFKISPRNLDSNEISMSVQLPTDNSNEVSQRGRKNKLKKILIPILVFVLLKAMTLIPLAIGILSLKAWNALQLSFISFLVSISLAIFQLCKKVAADSSTSPIAAHIPFEPYPSHYAAAAAAAARNFLVEPVQNGAAQATENNSQNMAYRGYISNETL